MLVSNINQQSSRPSQLLTSDTLLSRGSLNAEIANRAVRRVQPLILMFNAGNIGIPRPTEQEISDQTDDSLRAIEGSIRSLRNVSEGREAPRELVILLRLQLAVRTGNRRQITLAWKDLQSAVHNNGNDIDLNICGPGQLTRELSRLLEPLVIMTNDRSGVFTREDITRETERVRTRAELLLSITETFGGRQGEAAKLFRESLNGTLDSGNADTIRSQWRELRR